MAFKESLLQHPLVTGKSQIKRAAAFADIAAAAAAVATDAVAESVDDAACTG